MKIFFPFIFILFISSCGSNENKKSVSEKLTDINDVVVNLPDSAGKDLFTANCKTCHSLAYIQMQPNFPRKTWQKTVDKMIKNFGSPIDSVSASKIVDYLMAVRGKK